LNPLNLAIIQAVLYQTKESQIARTEIRRIGWVRSSGKSLVFNFGRDLLPIVTPHLSMWRKKMPPKCLRRNCAFSSCIVW
jgi:hypothetical protein